MLSVSPIYPDQKRQNLLIDYLAYLPQALAVATSTLNIHNHFSSNRMLDEKTGITPYFQTIMPHVIENCGSMS
jgi:hypothetical protein